MIFKNRICSISSKDKVLEIGPGANPHPRSDVYLELKFQNSEEAYAQSGYNEPIVSDRIIYYDGIVFPFKNNSFDYIICSHVIEHVDNIEEFINEINRVGKGKGYIEFPTLYYDYLFNIPEHLNLLKYKDRVINYCKKSDTTIGDFLEIQKAFNTSLFKGYGDTIINLYKDLFIQGFEWQGSLKIKREDLNKLLFKSSELEVILPQIKKIQYIGIKNALRKLFVELHHYIDKKWTKNNI